MYPYRPTRDAPALRAIHERLGEWAKSAGDHAELCATDQVVDLPVDDRAADLWEPLLIVAELAGGDWPAAARAACIAMVNRADDDDTTPGQQLLIDVHACLGAMDFISSSDLCTRLRMTPESPWMDDNLTMHKLGRMLTEYGIKSKKSHDRTHRGYYSKDFADAWSRYLPKQASKASQVSEKRADQHEQPPNHPDTKRGPDTLKASPDTTKASAASKASRQNPSSDHTADASDTSDGLFRVCPKCDRPTTIPGKCGPCIVKRVSEHGTNHDYNEGIAS